MQFPHIGSGSLKIGFSTKGISVYDATVVSPDIEKSNGVVHAIDTVLTSTSKVGLTPTEALEMLSSAVNLGVTAYNSGDHQGCCNIYHSTMKQLMDAGIDGADSHTTSLISKTLNHADESTNHTNRAWALRDGIDSLHIRLSSMDVTR